MKDVAVIGLGYVGLPTALVLASHGFRVNGFDKNQELVERIKRGDNGVPEDGLPALLRQVVESKQFVPGNTLVKSQAYIICVPTPLKDGTYQSDLSQLVSALNEIRNLVEPGNLVIVESTVPVGTTERVVVPILEQSGLSCKNGLLVAHSPETVLPGNLLYELIHNPRVVGGYTLEAAQAARRIYSTFAKSDIVLTDARTAEFVKLAENTYRFVNIALANDLALIALEKGVNRREAFTIANTHPRVALLNPGPGVGGTCVPIVPWFLLEGTSYGQLVRSSDAVNSAMPSHVGVLVSELVKGFNQPKIAVLGLAYKGNVGETRGSSSFRVIEEIERLIPGVTVFVSDPFVVANMYGNVPLEIALSGADCVVILTDHAEYKSLRPDYVSNLVRSRTLLDTRGVISPEEWMTNGFRIIQL